eukprot:Skav225836  [mRNA]  locus=scaffold345:69400:71139:+ [translate_table: standard]
MWKALLLLSVGGAADSQVSQGVWNFTVYSAPIKLRYGQVHNLQQGPLKLPEHIVSRYAGDKALAITGFDVEMVRPRADGSEELVKLNDHYLHHYILSMGSISTTSLCINKNKVLQHAAEDKMFARMLTNCHGMTRAPLHAFLTSLGGDEDLVTFGSAAGAEYRHNPQRYSAPFRRIVKTPQVWLPTFHVINTNKPLENTSLPYNPLLECPCTPQRKIDVAHGTIDGHPPDPPIQCSPSFAATGNPSCNLSTYVGGWRCCENGVFLIDTDKECSDPECSEEPQDEIFMKYKFYYEDATPETRHMGPSACCDVTGTTQGFENIEYDVPQCAAGTPPEKCLHIVETVQPVGYYQNHPKAPKDNHEADALVDLVFAAPHLHVAGLSMELFDAVTNKSICAVYASRDNNRGIMYGNGTQPGNENGYMTGLLPCKWNDKDAPRFKRNHPLRARAVYNSTYGHTGVMSLWLMDVSPVNEPDYVV